MKHTYLLLEDGKLRVYQSETEMPQPPELPKYRDKERDEFLGAEYLAELKSWKQQAKSAPVHETCEEKVKTFVLKTLWNKSAFYEGMNLLEDYYAVLKSGIKLPEGLVRFQIIPELDKNDIFSSTTPLKEYAFLV
jgi:hypothetical protein